MTSQLACTYAALILHDEGLAVSADNIGNLVKAANCEVEGYWPGLFAKALESADIDALLTSVSVGGGGCAAAAGGDAPAAGGDAAEEKKEEKKSSSEDFGGGAGMFEDDY
eukprot:TRINITY_DN656_c0_g1_i8.p2 TRINITY_DN656_c0_g1~~TRINITY_DN656_c0_g1_i8.p2  ORF type:complete len:110 (+),score=36.58 TRINITY_DN656_c0_g1_i8:139-468(+)